MYLRRWIGLAEYHAVLNMELKALRVQVAITWVEMVTEQINFSRWENLAVYIFTAQIPIFM
jgi:hypothetical protein